MYFKDKVVLITGASAGIGEALAYEFAKQEAKVMLCARNEMELQRVKLNITNTICEYFPCDITDHDAVDRMLEIIYAKYETVDVLVNNAGVSQRGLAYETPYTVDERIMEVNYFAAVYLTKKILPGMVERKQGDIIVISSLSGKFGFWNRSAYAASKHALQGFFESMQIELKEFHINTLIVYPGGVNTNIAKNALKKDGEKFGKVEDFHKYGVQPQDLARKVLKASEKHKKQVLIGKGEVKLYYIKKWWPWLFFKISAKVKR